MWFRDRCNGRGFARASWQRLPFSSLPISARSQSATAHWRAQRQHGGRQQILSMSPYEVSGDVLGRAQNEPSCAISTRNPQHILCGANDYRMVDVPGVTETQIDPRCVAGRVSIGRRRRHLGEHAVWRLLPGSRPASAEDAQVSARPPIRSSARDPPARVLRRHRLHRRQVAQRAPRHRRTWI